MKVTKNICLLNTTKLGKGVTNCEPALKSDTTFELPLGWAFCYSIIKKRPATGTSTDTGTDAGTESLKK